MKDVLYKWMQTLRKELKNESDRATVILSGSMIESILETTLKSKLVPLATSSDSLIEEAYAPISTFHAKIDLVHRLGLISSKFCRDLHIVRKIRNDFAHNISNCSFEDSAIQNRINELMRSSKIDKKMPNTRKQFPNGPRGDFLFTISWMLYLLMSQVEKIDSIKAAEEEFVYQPINEKEIIEANEGPKASRR